MNSEGMLLAQMRHPDLQALVSFQGLHTFKWLIFSQSNTQKELPEGAQLIACLLDHLKFSESTVDSISFKNCIAFNPDDIPEGLPEKAFDILISGAELMQAIALISDLFDYNPLIGSFFSKFSLPATSAVPVIKLLLDHEDLYVALNGLAHGKKIVSQLQGEDLIHFWAFIMTYLDKPAITGDVEKLLDQLASDDSTTLEAAIALNIARLQLPLASEKACALDIAIRYWYHAPKLIGIDEALSALKFPDPSVHEKALKLIKEIYMDDYLLGEENIEEFYGKLERQKTWLSQQSAPAFQEQLHQLQSQFNPK